MLYVVLVAFALVRGRRRARGDRGWLLALLAAPLAVVPARTVLGGARGPALIPVPGGTGHLQLAVGALATVGLVVGS